MILFTIATKRIKYLRINLPKETKELYRENYKIPMKEIKDDIKRWRYSMFSGRKNQYCENDHITKCNLQNQCDPYQIINGIFHRVLVTQSCPTLCNPTDCSSPGSSVHEIFQARILEWVAISFSRGSSQPRDQTWVSCIAGRFFTD